MALKNQQFRFQEFWWFHVKSTSQPVGRNRSVLRSTLSNLVPRVSLSCPSEREGGRRERDPGDEVGLRLSQLSSASRPVNAVHGAMCKAFIIIRLNDWSIECLQNYIEGICKSFLILCKLLNAVWSKSPAKCCKAYWARYGNALYKNAVVADDWLINRS